jgi:hypothetical protein
MKKIKRISIEEKIVLLRGVNVILSRELADFRKAFDIITMK